MSTSTGLGFPYQTVQPTQRLIEVANRLILAHFCVDKSPAFRFSSNVSNRFCSAELARSTTLEPSILSEIAPLHNSLNFNDVVRFPGLIVEFRFRAIEAQRDEEVPPIDGLNPV
jgi:hypothetical protein